jgi:hypothetical protein
MNTIASETILYKSPSPSDVFCFSPSMTVLPSGKILASFDIGGKGVLKLSGPKTEHGDFDSSNQGKIYSSSDNGKTWQHLTDLAMYHARLFTDEDKVYFIGHDKGITISVSCDEGKTWSSITELDNSAIWHQAPCACHKENGYIYLTMEKRVGKTWPGVAVVMLKGKLGTDLTDKKNWTFSNALTYPSELKTSLGVPFYPTKFLTEDKTQNRFCGDPGFLESHVVKIHDQEHLLYGEDKIHIFMRQHSGLTNIGALAECTILPNGEPKLDLVKSPFGSPMLHIPIPGGQMKFDVCYDEVSQYYWLVSTQATDSMRRPECLPNDRYGLPDNERHRLVLYFSTNMFDWCFAGIVAIGKTTKQSRHYASMVIKEDDILILSRSGDEDAAGAHNGNLITLHRIENFRKLVY